MRKVFTFSLFALVALLLATRAYSQCPPRYYEHLDANQVKARMHNGADHFWNLMDSPGYEVPVGSGKHSAFASSIWIGGLDGNNSLHLSAQTYRQSGLDFYSGPYRSNSNYVCGKGFAIPLQVLENGLKTLSSGKVVAFYANGFTVYDPTTNTSFDRFLPVARTTYRAQELPDGRILIFGDDQYPNKSDAMIVDTANFTTQVIGQLNHFHKFSSSTVLANGTVLLAGLQGCEVFDPATNTSTVVAGMSTPRASHPAVLLPNGKVLVAGGAPGYLGGGGMSTTEIYDPQANTWSAGPNSSIVRARASATLLPSGAVLIAGGTNLGSDFDLYDPATNLMSSQAGIQGEVMENSAILLGNGKVLINFKDLFSEQFGMQLYDPATATSVRSNRLFKAVPTSNMGGGLVMMSQSGTEFVIYDANADLLVDQPWQNMWKVSKAQINQFIADFGNNSVNFANYPDIETWPAHGDVSAGEDFHLAPFVDVNNDGLYRPALHGDYPCIEGDQALWWAYNDDGPHNETMGDPMGIQVEQMSYAYDCGTTPCGQDTFLDYATFHHLEITNKSSNNYTEVYIGVWLDADIGNFSDDFVGSDPELGLAFSYNGNPNDASTTGYGLNPPALGTKFLDNGQIGKATNVMYYENDFSQHGNPEQPVHYYNYMRSRWKDGSHLTVGGYGYSGTGPDTNFIYPGDPGFCGGTGAGGWSEVGEGNQPFDRRFLQSYGPFDLAAGEKVELDYVTLWARGFYNDNLGSVCELKKAAIAVDSFWQAQSHGCFNIVLNNQQADEVSNGLALYPNPNQGEFQVELEKGLPRGARLSVLDLTGRSVYQQELPPMQRRHRVATGNLPAGVYLVRVESDGMVLTKKMVLSR